MKLNNHVHKGTYYFDKRRRTYKGEWELGVPKAFGEIELESAGLYSGSLEFKELPGNFSAYQRFRITRAEQVSFF